MDANKAREEFPIWARMPIPAPVHIVEETEWRDMEKDQEQKWKWPLKVRLEPFWKKYMILIILCICLPIWTAAACLITGTIVRRNTEAEVTDRLNHEWRGRIQSYLDEQEQQRMASSLLTGEESRQAAMDAEADAIARLLYGYRNNSLRDRKTLIWCVLMRTDNGAYPNTVEAVIDQEQQWMFYSEENPVRQDDRDLALEQLQAWHEGRYPSGLATDYVYAEWTQSDIVLRNTWEKNSRTGYWRMPE